MVTKNEYDILLALWNAEHALSAKEIVASIEDKSFKDKTIHSILNTMLEKELIYVDGQKLSSRIYSRCFRAKITFEEFHATQIKNNAIYRREKQVVLPGIVSALIDDVDAYTLRKIESLLREKQKELGE